MPNVLTGERMWNFVGVARERANFLHRGVKGERGWAEFPWQRRDEKWVPCVGGTLLWGLLCFFAGDPDVTFSFPQFPVSV